MFHTELNSLVPLGLNEVIEIIKANFYRSPRLGSSWIKYNRNSYHQIPGTRSLCNICCDLQQEIPSLFFQLSSPAMGKAEKWYFGLNVSTCLVRRYVMKKWNFETEIWLSVSKWMFKTLLIQCWAHVHWTWTVHNFRTQNLSHKYYTGPAEAIYMLSQLLKQADVIATKQTIQFLRNLEIPLS